MNKLQDAIRIIDKYTSNEKDFKTGLKNYFNTIDSIDLELTVQECTCNTYVNLVNNLHACSKCGFVYPF